MLLLKYFMLSRFQKQSGRDGNSGRFPYLEHVFLYIVLSLSAAYVFAADINEITYEQAQQVAENFQALQDSLEQGKDQITDLEGKLEQIKANSEWLNNETHGKALQAALSKLEESGLSGKLDAAYDTLDTISGSADLIGDTVSDVKGKYDEVQEFYDRWHPDQYNPVRPLEQIASALEELESIIQDIDPSPDNILTKPITEIVGYYKDASTAFAGALTRVQEKIENRRGNCLGEGCGKTSEMAVKFTTEFPGSGPAWSYRPLTEGEIWYDGDGRAYLWWNNGWQELEGGLSRFEEVYNGWHLAHGEVISTSNLVARMNSDYSRVIESKQNAGKYWLVLNSSSGCHTDIFNVLQGRGADRGRLLKDANQDRDTFIARYMFNADAHREIDNVVNAFNNTLLVKGYINDAEGNSVDGAQITASAPAATVTGTSETGGWFSLLFNLQPDDTSQQNAAVSVSHSDYPTLETEQRLWEKCEDWNITLQRDETSGAEEALAEMRTIRDNVNASAAEVEGICSGLEGELDDMSSQLGELSGEQSPSVTDAVNPEDLQRAQEISRESNEVSKSLAESSQRLSGHVDDACTSRDQLTSIEAAGEKARLFDGITRSQQLAEQEFMPMRGEFGRLQSLAAEAGTIRTRVLELQDQTEEAGPDIAGNSNKQDELQANYSQALKKAMSANAAIKEIHAQEDRAASIMAETPTAAEDNSTGELAGIYAEIKSSRERAVSCTENIAGKLKTVSAGMKNINPEPSPGGNTVDNQQILALLDEAIDNQLIVERFFSLQEMEAKYSEGESCLASAREAMEKSNRLDEERIIAALNNCDVNNIDGVALQNSSLSPDIKRQYQELYENQREVDRRIDMADRAYGNCRFSESEQILSQIPVDARCKQSRQRVTGKILKSMSAVSDTKTANKLYTEADTYYRQKKYQQSYQKLQEAKGYARCSNHVDKIDKGMAQIREQVRSADNEKQQQADAAAGSTCQQYGQQMKALGIRQQYLAYQARRLSSEDEARALNAQVMENSRKLVALMDKARAAGCHDTDIPPEARKALGM